MYDILDIIENCSLPLAPPLSISFSPLSLCAHGQPLLLHFLLSSSLALPLNSTHDLKKLNSVLKK